MAIENQQNNEENNTVTYVVRKKGIGEGRRLHGKTKKHYCPIRIQLHIKEQIVKDHETVQKWIDKKVHQDYSELE